jgi:hypothetical protein
MVKEYETSHTAAESAGTNATDINNLGDAPFHSEADRIWISYVGSDEVCFSTSFFPAHTAPENEEKSTDISGADEKKPFFVESTRRTGMPLESTLQLILTSLLGRISGGVVKFLVLLLCLITNVISSALLTILFSFLPASEPSVLLPPIQQPACHPTLKADPILPSQPSEHPLHPPRSSSTTRKPSRKANGKTNGQSSVRHERISTSSAPALLTPVAVMISQKNKIIQNNHQARQADEACTALDAQIAELRNIPSDDTSRHSSSHSEFKAQRKLHKHKQEEFNAAKLATEEEVQALKEEIASLQQKHERYESRIAALNERRDRITDANAKGLDEVQRKDRERQAKREERNKITAFYTSRLQLLQDNIAQGNAALTSLTAAIEAVQQAMYADSPSTSSQNLSAPFGDTIPENSGLPPYTWNSPSAGLYATSGYVPMLGLSSTPQGPPHNPRA